MGKPASPAKARHRSSARTVVSTSPPLPQPESFAEFVIELSAGLATAPFDEVDAAIVEGLRGLASFLGLERAFLSRFRDGHLVQTHAWISDALAPHQAHFLEEVDPNEVWLASPTTRW